MSQDSPGYWILTIRIIYLLDWNSHKVTRAIASEVRVIYLQSSWEKEAYGKLDFPKLELLSQKKKKSNTTIINKLIISQIM